MVRWAILGMTVAACSAPLAPIATAPAPGYVLAEPLAPPVPVAAPPFDASRLSALQPIQPVAEAEAIEAPSRIVIASRPAETASLVIMARPAEPSPVRVVLVPAPEIVRIDPSVRIIPEPAPVVIAAAPAPPVLVRLPAPLYVPAPPSLTVFTTRPTTWGAACRRGDASACIMAQAVGSNSGI